MPWFHVQLCKNPVRCCMQQLHMKPVQNECAIILASLQQLHNNWMQLLRMKSRHNVADWCEQYRSSSVIQFPALVLHFTIELNHRYVKMNQSDKNQRQNCRRDTDTHIHTVPSECFIRAMNWSGPDKTDKATEMPGSIAYRVGLPASWNDVPGFLQVILANRRRPDHFCSMLSTVDMFIHCVSEKTTLMLHNITSTHINRFWWFLAEMLLREYTIEQWFVIPSLLTNVSALPGETWTPEIAFSVMLYVVSRKR